MNTWQLVLQIFPVITVIVGMIYHFATRDNKQSNIEKDYVFLKAIIKENHDIISKKIDLANIDAAHMKTEIELLKLRVTMIENSKE